MDWKGWTRAKVRWFVLISVAAATTLILVGIGQIFAQGPTSPTACGQGCPSDFAPGGVWPEGTPHSQYNLVCCCGQWVPGHVCASAAPEGLPASVGEHIARTSLSMNVIRGCLERDARIVVEMAARSPQTVVYPGEVWSAIEAAKCEGGWSAYSDGWGGGTCWWAELAYRAVTSSPSLTEIEWHEHPYREAACADLRTAIEETSNGVADYRFRNDTGEVIVVTLSVVNDIAVFEVRLVGLGGEWQEGGSAVAGASCPAEWAPDGVWPHEKPYGGMICCDGQWVAGSVCPEEKIAPEQSVKPEGLSAPSTGGGCGDASCLVSAEGGCPSPWAVGAGYPSGKFPEGYLHSNGTHVCCGGQFVLGRVCP